MGQVSLYGHEQLIVSTVDHDVSQEEVVGHHHSVKIEEDDVRNIMIKIFFRTFLFSNLVGEEFHNCTISAYLFRLN